MIRPHFTTRAFLAASFVLLTASAHAEQFKNFIYSDHGSYVTITGNTLNKTATTPLVIPESINGKPVKVIGRWAFSFLRTSGVTIPSTVTRIDDWAFYACYNLVSVTFPPSINSIGKGAFAGSENAERGLSSVIFTGKAPTVRENPFRDSVLDFKIFVEEGATGFTIPRWNGSKVSRPAPEIEIYDPAAPFLSYHRSAYLKNGESSVNFKSVLIGENSPWQTLLIRNVGSRDLTNLKIAVVRGHTRDFILGGTPKTRIKPGGIITLKLRFKPLKRGLRTSQLWITSNDSDERQFVVSLRGGGVALLE